MVFLFIGLLKYTALGQVLTAKDVKELISKNEVDYNFFKERNFEIKYSGLRKYGGMITHLENTGKNELLFVYADDSNNFQSLNYYLPHKKKYLDLFLIFKMNNINATKLGKTYENGKVYYQLLVQKNE